MRILEMRLENFQGVRKFGFSPGGKSCSIYGDNGTGKTTLYNAFCWVLYGRPSTDEKNYTPKTTGSHGLNHSVEMVVEYGSGRRMTLRKDFHEVYKTRRGGAEKAFAGHTTDYAVDGVPVDEKEFKKTVAGLVHGEETAKLLTRPGYFLEEMGVRERRSLLLEVCGGIADEEVIASSPALKELPELLGGHAVGEYQKIAAAQKKKIDAELKQIPGRIDEAERAKPDTGADDEEGLKKEAADLQERRDGLVAQMDDAEAAAGAELRRRIAEAEGRLAEEGAAYAKLVAAGEAERVKRVSALNKRKIAIQSELSGMELEKGRAQSEAEEMASRRDTLYKEWERASGEEWHGDTVCPTCGQTLPEEKVQEAKAAFNALRSERLEEITRQGQKVSMERIAEKKGEIAALEERIAAAQERLLSVEEELQGEGLQEPAMPPFEETEQYRAHETEARRLRSELAGLCGKSDAARSRIAGQVREIDGKVQDIRGRLAAFEAARRQDARVAELSARQGELARQYEEAERGAYLCELFLRRKAELLDDKVNSRFGTLKFRLFREQVNGGVQDDCEALVPCGGKLVPFKSANSAARVNAALEAADVLSGHFGVELPVWIDNCEGIVRPRQTAAQQIRLYVSGDDPALRVGA